MALQIYSRERKDGSRKHILLCVCSFPHRSRWRWDSTYRHRVELYFSGTKILQGEKHLWLQHMNMFFITGVDGSISLSIEWDNWGGDSVRIDDPHLISSLLHESVMLRGGQHSYCHSKLNCLLSTWSQTVRSSNSLNGFSFTPVHLGDIFFVCKEKNKLHQL